MSKNDITGDSLVNKPLSKQGEENWDRIFGKKKSRIDVVGVIEPSVKRVCYALNNK